MINNIALINFKSHKHTKITLGNLTVICGINGVGKSSLIQMLLLLRDAFLKDHSFDILDLQANAVKIGTVNDAIYEFGDYDGFEIRLKFNKKNELNFNYEALSENDKSKTFIRLSGIFVVFSLFNLINVFDLSFSDKSS